MARDHSAHWRRLIGASLVVLAAAFLAPRWIKAPDLDENRALAGPVAWPRDLKSLLGIRPAVEAYVADNFPPRAHLIGALNLLRLQIGVSGSSRVLVGRDGWLFYDDGSHLGPTRGDPPISDGQAREWLLGLAGRSESLRQRGISYVVVSPPEKEAVYPQFAPPWYPGPGVNRGGAMLSRLAAKLQVGEVLYLHDALAQQAHWGLKTYSRHDTHWTGLGAYVGYAAIMERLHRLGRTEGPRPIEAFTEVRAEESKPRNLALMLGIASFVDVDYPELDDPAMEDWLKVTYLSSGLDWTQPRVVDTGQTGKPVLLMTMDSFSNALLPFLYSHFSRIVLAHNQDGPWREDLIERFHPDIVILEVTESGLPFLMTPAPPASEAAQARIARTLPPPPPPPPPPGRRRQVGKVIEGTPGDDRLDGTERDDQIHGRPGNDTLNGLGGDDMLYGGRGNDLVNGGDGDDWVSGDRGDDTLSGGRGADTFHSFAGAGLDVVLDFSVAEGDRVMLDPGTTYTVRQEGADTVIEMTGARLVLKGVNAATIPPRRISHH